MLRTALRSSLSAVLAAAGALVVATGPAAAHTGHPTTGAADGFLHPLAGPDHLLAMTAVGVVAALAASRRGTWIAPLAFVGGMLAGGAAGLAGIGLPATEPLIVASVVALGLAVAAALRGAGDWFLAALVVAGLAHGHAHGAEAPAAANPVAYVAGFVGATVLLHLLGVMLGTAIRRHRALQVGLGAATTAVGVLLAV